MWSRLGLVCCLVVAAGQASWLDDCADGRVSLGGCLAGLCPVGSECVKNTCCKLKDGEEVTEATIQETTVTPEKIEEKLTSEEEEDEERATCKDGSKAIGECLGDFCPNGYRCENGNCCPPAATEPPTTTRQSRLTLTTSEATSKPTVIEPESEETPEGVCLIDKPIGECVDGRCPLHNECVEGKWCCPVTPQISCNDVLKECKKHLCDRQGYVEFMTLNCGRSCKRCDQQASSTQKPEDEKVVEKKKKARKCRNSRTDCDEWASQGFCTSALYSDEQKRHMCGVSCKMC